MIERSTMYRLSLPVKSKCKLSIDIPPEFEPMDKFRGTLGHKLNHNFKPNSRYTAVDSPRFGLIGAVEAPFRDLKEGEELLTNYGYALGPKWYQELRKKQEATATATTSTEFSSPNVSFSK